MEVAGGLKIKKSRVAAVQLTVAQARPSVRDHSPNEIGREVLAHSPRVLRRCPAVSRNASKKRKFLEFGGSSGNETKELRYISLTVHFLTVTHMWGFYGGSSAIGYDLGSLFTILI